MIETSHVNNAPCNKAAWNDQAEDSRSTSASGSDTETEVKQFANSEEDIQSTASENESELSRTDTKVFEPPASQAKDSVNSAQVFVMWVVGLLRCAKRAPQANTKYTREMLLQVRPRPDKHKKSIDALPRTVLAYRKMQAEMVEHNSTTPGFLLPPGLALPPGFTPPPGLVLPMSMNPSDMKSSHDGSKDCKGCKGTANKVACRFKKQMKEEQSGSAVPVASRTSPPGAVDPIEQSVPKVFDVVEFRKELVVVLRELSSDWNVGAAVQRVRSHSVPKAHQATQVVDIVTRAAEERRGVLRRLCFAFVAGLARADPSAFDKSEWVTGLRIFFDEVYNDLCDEIPRLRTIVANEFVPTLRSVLPAKELSELLPEELRTA